MLGLSSIGNRISGIGYIGRRICFLNRFTLVSDFVVVLSNIGCPIYRASDLFRKSISV